MTRAQVPTKGIVEMNDEEQAIRELVATEIELYAASLLLPRGEELALAAAARIARDGNPS